MNSAWDIVDQEVFEAERLWLLDVVDRQRYECRGCHIRVTPASFGRTNKVRPYFAARGGVRHQPDCNVDGEALLLAKARRGSVSDGSGAFPAPFPDRLELREVRPVRDPAGSVVQSGGGTTIAGAPAISAPRVRPTGPYAATTIRPLCRHYVNHPHDRHLPLRIGDVRSSYARVFRRLRVGQQHQKAPGVLFAPIRWIAEPHKSDAFLDITLNEGDWVNKNPVRPFSVRATWASWSRAQKDYTWREVQVARNEARDAAQKKRPDKAWVFFIGTLDKDDERRLLVEDHRLLCCLVVDADFRPMKA